ncbi:MAG: PA2779 family protein, partial [Thermodesulfobacteriota bacterium]
IEPGKNSATMREIDELKVRRALENKIVAEQLTSHGFTKGEVSAKLNQMSDEQVHQMASLADRIPAGGDGGLGIIIGILVIVALVLLIILLFKRI